MRPTSIRSCRAAGVVLRAAIALLALGMTGGAALAASPAPSPSPSPAVLPFEAWLDAPLPTDAAPGSSITIGALLWIPHDHIPFPDQNSFVRIYPATGDGSPVETPGDQDWPGHITATLAVPPGGVGRLEIGNQGSTCTPDGCFRMDGLYELPGVGPPDDAVLPQIATVDIELLLPILIAGEATPVDLVLRPKVDWPDFDAPDRLVLVVREPRAEPFATIPALLVDATTGRYEATLTVPDGGSLRPRRGDDRGRVDGGHLRRLDAQDRRAPRGCRLARSRGVRRRGSRRARPGAAGRDRRRRDRRRRGRGPGHAPRRILSSRADTDDPSLGPLDAWPLTTPACHR